LSVKNAVALARVIFTCLFFGGKNAVAFARVILRVYFLKNAVANARVSFIDLKSKIPRV
jgi:hypothetical protein